MPLNHDEMAYALMARDFADKRSLLYTNTSHVQTHFNYPQWRNDFGFAHMLIWNKQAKEGAFQYPPVNAILNYPFFKAAGFDGMLLYNGLMFIASVLLIYRLAMLLFRNPAIAITSCIIFLLGTFSWLYSRTLMIHTPGVTLTLAASYLGAKAYFSYQRDTALIYSLMAGMLVGIATGIRYDALLMLPAMVLPFLFIKPMAWKHIVVLMSAPLVLCGIYTVVTYYKFFIFHPFAYGNRTGTFDNKFLPFLITAALTVNFIWIVNRFKLPLLSHPRKKWIIILLGLAVVLAVIGLLWNSAFSSVHRVPVKGVMQFALSLIASLINQLVDGRIGINVFNPVKQGGYVNMALLQSCPHLMLLGWFLLGHPSVKENRMQLVWLALPCCIYILILSVMGMHGYIHPLRRLLMPVFPFTSVLCGFALWHISRSIPSYFAGLLALLFVAAAYFYGLQTENLYIDKKAYVQLELPLWIAGGIALCLVLMRGQRQSSRLLQYITLILVTVSFGWTTAIAASIYVPELKTRQVSQARLDMLRREITPGSVVASKDISQERLSVYLLPDAIFVQLVYNGVHVQNSWQVFKTLQDEGKKIYMVRTTLSPTEIFSGAPLILRNAQDGLMLFEFGKLPDTIDSVRDDD